MGGRAQARSEEPTPRKSLKINTRLHQKLTVLSGILDRDYQGTLEWLLSLEGHEELRRMRSAMEGKKKEG